MKLVAIGGGEIGRPGTSIETRLIDQEIVRLSGKKKPRLLFIPTASYDSKSYYGVVKNYFGEFLGCNTDVLYLIKEKPSRKEIISKIETADIIYVGGGNTLKMMKIWRKNGLDVLLNKAMSDGKVMSGVSAGAICWFNYGNSDSAQISKYSSLDKDETMPLMRVRGLGFVPGMACPHYDVEKSRKPALRMMIQEKGGYALALENCSAIEVVDDKYRIITSKNSASAYLVYKKKGVVVEERLPVDNNFRSLAELSRR